MLEVDILSNLEKLLQRYVQYTSLWEVDDVRFLWERVNNFIGTAYKFDLTDDISPYRLSSFDVYSSSATIMIEK